VTRRPVFPEIAKSLQSRIASGCYSTSPLPAERELAEEFGVNRRTLRKAIEILEQEQVVTRRRGMGTFATAAATAAATVGVETILYAGETQGHFYQELYQALSSEARDRRWAVTAFTPVNDSNSRAAFRKLLQNQPRLICSEDAWHIFASEIPAEIHVTRVSGFHSVSKVKPGERPGYIISSDTYRAAQLAVEHLVELGHRQIGFVSYGSDNTGSYIGQINARENAYLGYRAALSESGIAEIHALGVPDNPQFSEFDQWHRLCLNAQFSQMQHLPSGFVCLGDFRAVPLLQALRDQGLRVPDDVSVVGIGNTPWARAVEPQLTSVCLGETQMARLALTLNGEPKPDTARIVRVEPQLVVRKSTANAADA